MRGPGKPRVQKHPARYLKRLKILGAVVGKEKLLGPKNLEFLRYPWAHQTGL
jgi:hypothetical protein